MIVECDYCGDTFDRKPSRVKSTDNQFCGEDCYAEWQSENRVGQSHHQYGRITVECDNCGNEKDVRPSHAEQVDNFYCDNNCQIEDQGHPSQHQKKDKVCTECEWCDSEFKVYPYRLDIRMGRLFCSMECKDRWMSETLSGENHPQYKGGPQYYGSDWLRKRQSVVERDNDVCQLCGKEADGRSLDVHHIRPVRDFDNPNDAHFMDNMVQLCRSCHRKCESLEKSKQIDIFMGG